MSADPRRENDLARATAAVNRLEAARAAAVTKLEAERVAHDQTRAQLAVCTEALRTAKRLVRIACAHAPVLLRDDRFVAFTADHDEAVCKIEAEKRRRGEILGALIDVLRGCPACDHDEAEGEVIDHCDECCRRVTATAWTLVHGDEDG